MNPEWENFQLAVGRFLLILWRNFKAGCGFPYHAPELYPVFSEQQLSLLRALRYGQPEYDTDALFADPEWIG